MVLCFEPAPTFRTCATKVFEKDELHITRRHHNSVLILMASGILRFREDGHDVELSAGEYYVQRDTLFQEGVRLGEMPVYFYIEFAGSYSNEQEAGLPLRGRFTPRNLMPLLEHFEELYQSRRANPFLLNSYMSRVFSELWTASPRHDEGAHVAGLIRNDLDARYAEQISLADLAHRFGYTEDYLIRIFKRQYGTTPHRYQIGVRMDHARWLLENTSLTVQQVAFSVGYRDFSAFYRAFRARYGRSPSGLM